jgi:hypothetical protein
VNTESDGKIIDGKTRAHNGVGKRVNDIAADFTAPGRGDSIASATAKTPINSL